ncbi:MAG: hypothetical protein M0C28_23900 [Candidatus Moduliflexus flocculans]|nr:hypothetical protein [Candidatus Moduliflexus flocculans]
MTNLDAFFRPEGRGRGRRVLGRPVEVQPGPRHRRACSTTLGRDDLHLVNLKGGSVRFGGTRTYPLRPEHARADGIPWSWSCTPRPRRARPDFLRDLARKRGAGRSILIPGVPGLACRTRSIAPAASRGDSAGRAPDRTQLHGRLLRARRRRRRASSGVNTLFINERRARGALVGRAPTPRCSPRAARSR